MEQRNLPVQVIAHCTAEGELLPLRFRYEDEEHCLHTVRVREVTDRRRVEYVGIEALQYLCKSEEQGKERLYELRYTVRSHKWCLMRRVY